MDFGATLESRFQGQGSESVHAWGLSRVTDSVGSYTTVRYGEIGATGEAHPQRLDYAGHEASGLMPYNSVRYRYDTAQSGTARLAAVRTYQEGTLVADYRIHYADDAGGLPQRVSAIEHCDGGGRCLPATTFHWQEPELLVTAIDNGIGGVTRIRYDALPELAAQGEDALPPPAYVVSLVERGNGSGSFNGHRYRFLDGRMSSEGRGFLGFRQRIVTDLQTGVEESTTYRQDFPYTSRIASETRELDGLRLHEETFSYDVQDLSAAGDIGGRRVLLRIIEHWRARRDLSGTPLPTETTKFRYDDFGNDGGSLHSISDGTSRDSTNTYADDHERWYLNRLARTTVVHRAPAMPDITRTSSFAYDRQTGLLIQEVIEPDLLRYRLQTDYRRDLFGNIIESAVTGDGFERLTTEFRYDSLGRFPVQILHPFGLIETLEYDARFGLPARHTDEHGNTERTEYDGFGRESVLTGADGQHRRIEYLYCAGVANGAEDCPAHGAFVIQATEEASGDNGRFPGPRLFQGARPAAAPSVTRTYYDNLSRPIMQDVRTADGRRSRRYTEYDGQGNAVT